MNFSALGPVAANQSAKSAGVATRNLTPIKMIAPILTRSKVLLELLLSQPVVELELVSSVVSLDPGLAYNTWRLTQQQAWNAPIWSIPLLVVTAGTDDLLRLVRMSPEVQSNRDEEQPPAWVPSVLRGVAARTAARLLGRAECDSAYLAGLLWDFPGTDISSNCQLRSPAAEDKIERSRLCNSLAIDFRESWHDRMSVEDMTPVLEIAMAITLDEAGGTSTSACPVSDTERTAVWPGVTPQRQREIMVRCRSVTSWAANNVFRLSPWEFWKQLEIATGSE